MNTHEATGVLFDLSRWTQSRRKLRMASMANFTELSTIFSFIRSVKFR